MNAQTPPRARGCPDRKEGVDTVLFDLGNVLFPFNWTRAIRGFANALGRTEEALRADFAKADYAILFYEYGTGRMSTESFVKRLSETLGAGLNLETVARHWCSIFEADAAMLRLLDTIGRQCRTFILSDTDLLHWTYLDERYELESRVSGAILSFRTGSMKADPGAFKKIVSTWRFDPCKTLFIDDLERNLTAAAAVGIRTHLHRDCASTAQTLAALGFDAGPIR